MKTRERQAVRAVLLTPAHTMLMLRLRNRRGVFWIAPGGGMLPGETDADALRRELHEETGLRASAIGPHVWSRETTYVLEEGEPEPVAVRQFERFYLLEVEAFEASAHNMPQELERDWFQGFGWVGSKDITMSSERFVPTRLATCLHALAVDGPPAAPIDIGR